MTKMHYIEIQRIATKKETAVTNGGAQKTSLNECWMQKYF